MAMRSGTNVHLLTGLTVAMLWGTALIAQQTQPADSAPVGGGPQTPQRRPAQRAAGNVPVPENLELVRDVVFATARDKDGLPIELKMDCAFLKQSDGKPMPVILYIHGGGWSGGDRAVGLPLSFPFAQGGYFACTIDYRLSGQATFPAQMHDVKAAVRFIRAHADKLAIDPDRIGVWGHSAGGHLSALLGTLGNDAGELEGEVGEKSGSSAVQAVVSVSGPFDLVLAAPSGDGGPMIRDLLGGTVVEKKDLARQASPVNHVDAKDAPLLIIQGGNDRLVPDEQAEVMRDALKKAGVEMEYLYIEDAGHGVPDRRAFFATAAFFDKHLGGQATQAMQSMARRLENARGNRGGRRDQRPAGSQPNTPTTRPD
jgi:acetyl esterase/lipase